MSVLFPRNLTVKVKSEGYYGDGGKWVEPALSPSTITGDAQPMKAEEIESLDIGRRELGKIKIFTDEVLDIASESEKKNGTIIIYDDGNEYEVIGVDKHRSGILENTKYIAELRKGGLRSA